MFGSFLTVVHELKAAVAAGDYRLASAKLIELQQLVYDFAFGVNAAAAPDAKGLADLTAACQEVVAAATAASRGPSALAIGDGRFLNLIIQFLPLLLDLFKRT